MMQDRLRERMAWMWVPVWRCSCLSALSSQSCSQSRPVSHASQSREIAAQTGCFSDQSRNAPAAHLILLQSTQKNIILVIHKNMLYVCNIKCHRKYPRNVYSRDVLVLSRDAGQPIIRTHSYLPGHKFVMTKSFANLQLAVCTLISIV